MASPVRDLRLALRTLARAPGFTVPALLTLALGIGATTAIFSVVNAVLLRPLDVPDPGRVALLWERKLEEGTATSLVSPPTFADWRERTTSFAAMSALAQESLILGGEEPERLAALAVSPGFFDVVGVSAMALGRGFVPEEEREGGGQVAVLSDGLWRRRFGADRDLIGRAIRFGDRSMTVVGVLPASFRFPEPAELFVPFVMAPDALAEGMRGARYLRVLARLNDGVSPDAAAAELAAVAGRLAEEHPNNAGWGTALVPLHEQMVRGVRPRLLLLWGAVAVVLGIACANVANLALARAAGRRTEIAVRAALGAGRGRLLRELLAENVVLALAGGAAGLLLAYWLIGPLVSLAPVEVPRLEEAGVDLRVLLFALATSLLAGTAVTAAPALATLRSDPGVRLAGQGRTIAAGGRGRLRNALLIGEVALSLVLLVGAGLLVRSFLRMRAVEAGFRTEGVQIASLSLPPGTYGEPARQVAFFESLLERLAGAPGVETAGGTTSLPLGGSSMRFGFRPEEEPGEGTTHHAQYHAVTPDYLRTLAIPLRRGRGFTDRDVEGAPPVALINETLARRFWPAVDPVGRRIVLASRTGLAEREIVGVVGDTRHAGLGVDAGPEIYVPYAQDPWPFLTVALRTSGQEAAVAGILRQTVRSLDAGLPVGTPRPMDDLVAGSLAPLRFPMQLFGAFAGLALVLVAVGMFGLIGYLVRRETRAIGIRMALGAGRGDVLRLILGRSAGVTAAGLVLGLAGALGLGRLLRGLLFGVSAADPATLLAGALLLAAVSAVASWIPARRALRVDPMEVLRYE